MNITFLTVRKLKFQIVLYSYFIFSSINYKTSLIITKVNQSGQTFCKFNQVFFYLYVIRIERFTEFSRVFLRIVDESSPEYFNFEMYDWQHHEEFSRILFCTAWPNKIDQLSWLTARRLKSLVYWLDFIKVVKTSRTFHDFSCLKQNTSQVIIGKF